MTVSRLQPDAELAGSLEARAAALRRAAADLRNAHDRSELEAIAAGYEADAARIRSRTRLTRT
jgi:hypothetical protein